MDDDSEPFLLDANTLLNAAFVDGSWSQVVVQGAAKKQVPIYIGSLTLEEARKVARERAAEAGRQSDPVPTLEQYVRRSGFLVVTANPGIAVPPTVPRHDAHVYQEAVTAGAVIVTSDAALWRGAAGRATLPLQVLRDWLGDSTFLFAYGVPPTRERGSFFFRGVRQYPAFKGMRARLYTGDFGAAAVYYDTETQSWRAEFPGTAALTLAGRLDEDVEQVVSLSWKAPGRAELRVGSINDPAQVDLPAPLHNPFARKFQIAASSANPNECWNGVVSAFVFNDRPIGQKLWAKLRRSAVVTPNPYDSDRLVAALRKKLPS